MKVDVRRVYDQPVTGEGRRVLVDRLWPRGVRREGAPWDLWERDVAPSTELRAWFGHRPERFAEFATRYREELRAPSAAAALDRLRALAEGPGLVLLTAARDQAHNQAVVLREVLEGGPSEKGA